MTQEEFIAKEKAKYVVIKGALERDYPIIKEDVNSLGVDASTVNTLIAEYITANNLEHLTTAQISNMISDYWAAHPDTDRTDAEVNALIETYMAAHPITAGHTDEEITALAKAYHDSQEITIVNYPIVDSADLIEGE
jgi:hypothetical protein